MARCTTGFAVMAASTVLAAGAASAATVAVRDSTRFLAFTAGQATTSFNGIGVSGPGSGPLPAGAFFSPSPPGSALAVDGFSFAPVNASVNVNAAGYYDAPGIVDLTDQYLVNSYPPSGSPLSLTMSLPFPVTAFGLQFSGLFSRTTATFALSNGFSVAVPVDDFSPPVLSTQFLGFLSDAPFDTVSLSVPGSASWVVASVTTATATMVPEPATWAMLALGLIGLGAFGRRRTGRSAAPV